MGSYIRWTEEEIDCIINRTIELRLKEIEPSLLHLINQAQEELLSVDRRRPIRNIITVWKLIAAIKNRMSKPKAEEPKAEPNRIAAIEENHILLLDEVSTLRNEIKMLRNELSNMRKKKVMRIGIVGLIGNQFSSINNAFDGVKLYNIENVNAMPTNIDYMLYMTRFIKHEISNKIESLLPKEKIIQINGGITKVKEVIRKLNEN